MPGGYGQAAPVPTTTSLTVSIETLPGGAALRADARCAQCGSSLGVQEGIYVIRLSVDDDLRLVRGKVRRLADEREWSFASGTELARLIGELGHHHT